MLFVVFLSVLAAFLFALSAAVQQRAAQQNSRPYSASRGSPRLLIVFPPLIRLTRRLVRSPLWLAGWAVNLVGFMAQAVALHLGSVAVVQVLLVTQLLFALPLAAAWNHRRLTRWDWLSATAVCGGLSRLPRGAWHCTSRRRSRSMAGIPRRRVCGGAGLLAGRGGRRTTSVPACVSDRHGRGRVLCDHCGYDQTDRHRPG